MTRTEHDPTVDIDSLGIEPTPSIAAVTPASDSSVRPPEGRPDAPSLFERWLAQDEGAVYAVRWALEECSSDSPWHSALLERFLALPLQLGHIRRLEAERIERAISQCGDHRVEEWLRMGIATDLTPDVHALMLIMALRLADPAWDQLLLDLAADPGRSNELRSQVLEQYIRTRVELSELPSFIGQGYAAGRLTPTFVEKWVPMLLARPGTRDAMATTGMEAVLEEPSADVAGELVAATSLDVDAHSYRFASATVEHVSDALEQLASDRRRSYGLRSALPGILEGRAAMRNSAGTIVRRIPWDFAASSIGSACVPIWPDHIQPIVDSLAPGLHLAAGGPCPQPGDFAVADVDGNGSDDLLVKGVSDSIQGFILILNAPTPSLMKVADAGRFDSAYRIEAGVYYPDCYSGVPEVTWLPHEGFSISFDDKFSREYYVADGDLVVQDVPHC